MEDGIMEGLLAMIVIIIFSLILGLALSTMGSVFFNSQGTTAVGCEDTNMIMDILRLISTYFVGGDGGC